MAIHDDNWTKEFAKMSDRQMTHKERTTHILLGLLMLFFISLPFLPATVWTTIAPGLAVVSVVGGVALGLWMITQGVRGRW